MTDKQSYVGPARWETFAQRFGPRLDEWFMAAAITGCGMIFMTWPSTFNLPTYTFFKQIFGGDGLLWWLPLPWVMFLLGAIRFIGLAVNGARKEVTPLIRRLSAAGGLMIWNGMFYCFLSSGVPGLWIIFFPIFSAIEISNVHRAALDQGAARSGRYR